MKKQILSFTRILGTSMSVMAAKSKPAKVDWFVGNSKGRITCDGDGEADKVILQMADAGGGRDNFKESMTKAGIELSDKLVALLAKKEVSGTTFEEEMDDYIKKAVCLTKVSSSGPVAKGFDKRFKKNLGYVEFLIKDNRKTMPSYEDATTNSEKSNAYANDIIEANRGAVTFVITMFENR